MSIPTLIEIRHSDQHKANYGAGQVITTEGNMIAFNDKTQCLVKHGNEYYGMALEFNGDFLILRENIEGNSMQLVEVDKIYLIIE